jgi:hypothetical protein
MVCLSLWGSRGKARPSLFYLKGWVKGVVFVNGHNLGRYWNVGPQETLYLPGVWLDKGINKVGILVDSPLFPGNSLPISAPHAIKLLLCP